MRTIPTILLLVALSGSVFSQRIETLIVDGQNNHQWEIATQTLKATLENSGRFAVNVATSPPAGKSMENFRPSFAEYRLVVLNYNGEDWASSTRQAFIDYVQKGGGVVVYHAADNSFPGWTEYNEVIGLGGWGDRNEAHGPYIRWRDGKIVRDTAPGKGGSHGRRHAFVIDNRAPEHPIMRGLPPSWLHSTDELYDRLRGPAKDLEVLATAYSDPKTGGSGEHEPILMTIRYGAGRVFHTVLGDNLEALFDVGLQTTLLRGAEWAATGNVTIPVPACFPTRDRLSTSDPFTPYLRDAVGWKPAFNGKDLTGWKQVNGTATYEVIRDRGELVGKTAKGSPNSFLATEKEYADFELRFQVRLDNPELNSGVQIRSHQYEQATEGHPKGRVYGYQVEIEASSEPNNPNKDLGDAGFIYDEARRGWLSKEEERADPRKRSVFVNGAWNQYHIRFVGQHAETWINGIKIADLRDEVTAAGRIMLQVHSIPEEKGPWSVRWKNIVIRELGTNEPH